MGNLEHHYLTINGLKLHIAIQGEGPLILMTHGFPESWYSWRHQIPALAAAGYRVAALDMPGYGESDAPQEIDRYNQIALSEDMVALASALGYQHFSIVGHDYGAPTAWYTALRFPEQVDAMVAMSVPYGGRSLRPPTDTYRYMFSNCFFYMLYFQEPGVAEAELEADIPRFLRTIFFNLTGDNSKGFDTTNVPATAGFFDAIQDPQQFPGWLDEEESAYYVDRFEKSGLHGAINYYRNLDRNWQLQEAYQEATVQCPSLFIAGEQDPIPRVGNDLQRMSDYAPGIKKIMLPNCGHWTQQEQPELVNQALVNFFSELKLN